MLNFQICDLLRSFSFFGNNGESKSATRIVQNAAELMK